MEKIKNILNNKYDNHIMPFLWMHGEDKVTIQNYIQKINLSGIRSVCIESRPHHDFLKEKWWDDVDLIIEECEKLGMTVWILDDKHFPTGYAAGEVKKTYPMLQKEFLNFKQLDLVGPKANAGILLDWMLFSKRPYLIGEDEEIAVEKSYQNKILAVIAAPRTAFNQIDETRSINVTEKVMGKTLFWDIPAGEWSLFVFYITQEGGEGATEGYLNPLVPEATDILINTVYESHYERYSSKFGSVIKGFFSDEPRFGNVKGPDAILGKVDMPLPWKSDFIETFAQYLKISEEQVIKQLPMLYRGNSNEAAAFRYAYMDFVSTLYSQNFSNRIGKWCSDHHVEYMGHVIEDNNAHSRLGYGAGHFFKSMSGQHMAGIDVVLHQLLPMYDKGYFKSMTSTGWDGEFFHYALGKMGASLGNLDPIKKGRTMCEVFGAYGWAEGVKMMKWMLDHLLVRGVNYFVPHAFTMADFPDADCPPHFYGHGNNPQFGAFKLLMDYTNRTSDLFTGGKHQADIGILYHGEAEWAGEAMLLQKPAKILTQNQVEFEIVSSEMVIDSEIHHEAFVINHHALKTLIVPMAEKLPLSLIKKLDVMASHSINIIFLDEFVVGASEVIDDNRIINTLKEKCKIINLNELMKEETILSSDRLIIDGFYPYLRYYHYQQEGQSIVMLFNESTVEDYQVNVKFGKFKNFEQYDAFDNKMIPIVKKNDGYEINLANSEAIILIEGETVIGGIEKNEVDKEDGKHAIILNDYSWDISFEKAVTKENIHRQYSALPLLGLGDEFTDFAGIIKYKTTLKANSTVNYLCIEEASEVVTISINGEQLGTKISYPYRFDIKDRLVNEENELEIEVITNLGRRQRDYLSQFIALDPVGISGKVEIK